MLRHYTLEKGVYPFSTAPNIASNLDRTADLLLSEGRVVQAERLAKRAAELRESAL